MVLLFDIIKSLIITPEEFKKCSDIPDIDLVVIKYESEEKEKSILKKGVWLYRKLREEYITSLNMDPDIYCYNAPVEVLEDAFEIFSYLYTNSDGAGITDHVFDTIEYYLNKKYKALNKRIERVGAIPLEKLRVKLPYPMGSLEKLKPGQKNFQEYILSNKKIFVSEKLDGVSSLWFEGKLYTRGNGEFGGDITHLKKYISGLVNTRDPVRGELVIKKSLFEKWKRDSANPRSFVSGKTNLSALSKQDIEKIKDIEFVAYELVESNLSPQVQFSSLETMGFSLPRHEILTDPTSFQIAEIYQRYRKESDYLIDGLVIQKATPSSRNSTFAFKMLLEEQVRETRVNNIEWRISRHGRYVPVALYDTVYIDGNRYHRAYAFNASWVREKSLGPGTEIKIARSGDVIPQIINVKIDPSIRPIYPSTKYSWTWSGKDIVLVDIEGNRDVKIARLVYFFETLNIPRLRTATLTKFFDSGLDTVSKITNAKKEEFSLIKGVGKKLSESFYLTIQTSLRTLRLDRLMIASGIFKGLGTKLLRTLYRQYPEALFENVSKEKISSIEGYGPKRAHQFMTQLESFKRFMKEIKEDFTDAYHSNLEARKTFALDIHYPVFSGKNVVFTGYYGDLPLTIEDFVYDHDCKISQKIDSDTLCVVANSITNITEKMRDALSKKIPVFTEEEFCIKYGIKKEESEIVE